MKKILFTLAFICSLTFTSFSQQNQKGINYQAVARTLDGEILDGKSISLKMSLVSGGKRSPKAYYSEIHDITTNQLGIFEIAIGDGKELSGSFSRIPWATEEIWLQIAIDENGGDNYKIASTSRLLAVPYALHSLTASNLVGEEGNNLSRNSANGVSSNTWSLKGNNKVDPTDDQFGSVNPADLVIITDNQERMRILSTGEILMNGDLEIQDKLSVLGDAEINLNEGSTNIHGPLIVKNGSATTLSGDLNVNRNTALEGNFSVNNGSETVLSGPTTIEGPTDINNDLNVSNKIRVPYLTVDTKADIQDAQIKNSLDVLHHLTSPYLTVGINAVLTRAQVYTDLEIGNNTSTNSLNVSSKATMLNVDVDNNLDVAHHITAPYLTIDTKADMREAQVNSNLSVASNTSTKTLDVEAKANIEDLEVGNNAIIQKDLTVNGNTNIAGNINVTSAVPSVFDNLTVTNNTNSGSLDVGSYTNTNTLNVLNNTSTNTLTVRNNSTIKGDLTTEKDSKILGSLTVAGSTILQNNAAVTGNLKSDGTFTSNGPAVVNNSLKVGGTTNLNNGLNVKNGSATSLTGTLNVQQNATISGNATLGGFRTDVNGILYANSAASITGNLTANGYTKINNQLQVTGLSSLGNVKASTATANSLIGENTFKVGGLNQDQALLEFFPNRTKGKEELFDNYVLQVSGSQLGMAIKTDGSGPSNNYISFFNGSQMKGRIEGKPGVLWSEDNARSLVNYDPKEANTASGTEDLNAANAASNADSSLPPARTVANTEEIVEYIVLVIDFIASAITLATSFSSVLDPVDVFEAALGLAISFTSVATYIGFTIANVGVAYESGSGDYAEWLQKERIEEVMTYGDVVGLRGGKISKALMDADRYMVVSAAPAVIGAMPESEDLEEQYEKIAFIGQVPVKVRGEVHIGDYILPTGEGDGLAIAVPKDKMKARDYARIIGVSWEDWNEEDKDKIFQMIKVAVGINQNDMAGLIDQMQVVMNQMQDAIKEINPNFEAHMFDTDSELNINSLDYSVAPTHDSAMEGFFDGKDFDSREELGQLVADALQSQTGIDLAEYPLVDKMLKDPAYAEAAKDHYSKLLVYYTNYLQELKSN